MAAIPFLKVAVLLVKQLSKPLTRALKARSQVGARSFALGAHMRNTDE